MERDILNELLLWKNNPNRKPALINGVRQCGKTWIMKELGSKYPDCAYFNFEEQNINGIFDVDFSIDRIVNMLGVLRNKPIDKDCLIILDEIQLCSRAITSLKYFCEDGRFDVVCAGSLLGVKMMTTSPPVGKIDDFYMYPLSFREFLKANGQNMLVNALECDSSDDLITVFGEKLKTYYLEYLAVGGLPEAVESWINKHDAKEVDSILSSLTKRYVLDIMRYGDGKVKSNGEYVWKSLPSQLAKDNNKFVLGHVAEGIRARDLWSSIEWLDKAGLAYRVPITTGVDEPSIQSDSSSFKLYCFDTGIMRTLADISLSEALIGSERSALYRGAVTENYVLCELRKSTERDIWCWRSGNKAEVDFLTKIDDVPVPIEVKAGNKIKANSLKVYLDRHDGMGIIASMNPLAKKERVLMIPLYAFWLLPKILKCEKYRQS